MAVRRLRIASGGVLLLAALVVGVLTAVLTATWLGSQDPEGDGTVAADPGTNTQMTTVVVIRNDIPAGTTLSTPLLREIEIAADTALLGVYTTSNRVVGRVTRYPLVAGEQVVESKLVGTETTLGTGLAFSVPEGMRAVSVPFSEVMGAGGLVVPGDQVDVLVHTNNERLFGPGEVIPEGDGGRPIVVTVLQDVLVLAVGQLFTPPADSGRDPATLRSDTAPAQPGARSVTLAVTPAQAQLMFFASQEGTLGLAMRSFGDDSFSVLSPEFKLDTELGSEPDLQVTR
jgi:pilus assembly protein CpaB